MTHRPVVLGPCPCHGCRVSVYYDGLVWRNSSRGGEHDCPNRRSIGYNGAEGSSFSSRRLAHDALVPATTRSEGVVASIEVVAR